MGCAPSVHAPEVHAEAPLDVSALIDGPLLSLPGTPGEPREATPRSASRRLSRRPTTQLTPVAPGDVAPLCARAPSLPPTTPKNNTARQGRRDRVSPAADPSRSSQGRPLLPTPPTSPPATVPAPPRLHGSLSNSLSLPSAASPPALTPATAANTLEPSVSPAALAVSPPVSPAAANAPRRSVVLGPRKGLPPQGLPPQGLPPQGRGSVDEATSRSGTLSSLLMRSRGTTPAGALADLTRSRSLFGSRASSAASDRALRSQSSLLSRGSLRTARSAHGFDIAQLDAVRCESGSDDDEESPRRPAISPPQPPADMDDSSAARGRTHSKSAVASSGRTAALSVRCISGRWADVTIEELQALMDTPQGSPQGSPDRSSDARHSSRSSVPSVSPRHAPAPPPKQSRGYRRVVASGPADTSGDEGRLDTAVRSPAVVRHAASFSLRPAEQHAAPLFFTPPCHGEPVGPVPMGALVLPPPLAVPLFAASPEGHGVPPSS